MKFARYLEETQIPEWKRAYIDYRGLKKRINAIRLSLQNAGSTPLLASPVVITQEVQTHSSNAPAPVPTLSPEQSTAPNEEEEAEPQLGPGATSNSAMDVDNAPNVPLHALQKLDDFPGMSRPVARIQEPDARSLASSANSRAEATPHARAHFSDANTPQSGRAEEGTTPSHRSIFRAATVNMGFLPRLNRRNTGKSFWEPSRRSQKALQWDLARSIPLKDLIPMLTGVQRSFFLKLDMELDKVESFYVEREKEMNARTGQLRIQLEELRKHGRAFHEAHDNAQSWIPSLIRRKAGGRVPASDTFARKRRSYKADNGSPPGSSSRDRSASRPPRPVNEAKATEEGSEVKGDAETPTLVHVDGTENEHASGSGSGGEAEHGWGRFKHPEHKLESNISAPSPLLHLLHKHEPDDYLHAKKKLRKAMLECYRGLEILENYRTLNLIGFRKALKKFEKYVKIPAQQAYFLERIEPCAFSSGAAVQAMMSEMERLYAARFARGDTKLAKTRLRGQASQKTHHYSTFRTGLLLGLAIPAFIDGLVLSFKDDTRQKIPDFNSLYYIYSILLIPTLFSLLVGFNILGWSKARINYIFIFELDIRTKMDHREYFEIPALLLSTMCYSWWLSFSNIGSPHFAPFYWPLIWIIFAAVLLFDPLPLLYRSSRWWLVRNVSRLLVSGTRRVEFTDFWMGDQFCSLVYLLSNLTFIGCLYSGSFEGSFQRCTSPRYWGVRYAISILPFVARFAQSIKRWFDSRLVTHLINAGKYGTGIIYYLCYFIWRHQGDDRGASFAAWCIFGTIYAAYASAWDILMDWSLLKAHVSHPLLRSDLLYGGYIPFYYLAIITNIVIRFSWVIYIPRTGINLMLRVFINALLEIFRRVQWNFFRLENEHVGNMDQYRVTREVPLPYAFDEINHDDDGDEDEDRKSVSSWRKKGKQVSPPEDDVLNDDGAFRRQGS